MSVRFNPAFAPRLGATSLGPPVWGNLRNVDLSWYPGSGVGPRPGDPPPRQRGLYLSADVLRGQHIEVLNVQVDRRRHTLTVTADQSNLPGASDGESRSDARIESPDPRIPERWTIIVQNPNGETIYTRRLDLGGAFPP